MVGREYQPGKRRELEGLPILVLGVYIVATGQRLEYGRLSKVRARQIRTNVRQLADQASHRKAVPFHLLQPEASDVCAADECAVSAQRRAFAIAAFAYEYERLLERAFWRHQVRSDLPGGPLGSLRERRRDETFPRRARWGRIVLDRQLHRGEVVW